MAEQKKPQDNQKKFDSAAELEERQLEQASGGRMDPRPPTKLSPDPKS